MTTMSGKRSIETTIGVNEILARCYNLKALRVTELVSYSCRNFAIEVVDLLSQHDIDSGDRESGSGAKIGNSRAEEGGQKLVLKIMSLWYRADRTQAMRQQVICSQLLREQGFLCPRVIFTSQEEMFGSTASDRCTLVMTMLPGQQLGADHIRISSRVLFEVGALLAYMHLALQEGDPQCLEPDPSDPWVIENIHLLSQYLSCIQDKQERLMMEEIITKFQQIRLDKFPMMKKSIIHGDFHDYNLIVDWDHWDNQPFPPSFSPQHTHSSPTSPSLLDHQRSSILQKYGIIDFEDMSLSYPALELSRLMADMMSDCHQVPLFDIGGHVIAGYVSVDCTPVKQFSSYLYDTVLACLVQYVVLSVHDFQAQKGNNEYLLISTDDSRIVLKKLRTVDIAEVYSAWGKVLTGYGLDNPFTVLTQNWGK